MTPLISVVIPAYNHERYIAACINSIISQSYENIELIVVNDGSKDGTASVIQGLANRCEKRFARFVFIDKENEGVNKTLNKGLSLVKGKYVFMCSSDDMAPPNAIASLFSTISESAGYGFAVGNCLIMDDDNTHCFWDKKRNNVYERSKARYLSFSDFLMKTTPQVDFFSEDFGSYRSLLEKNYIPNGFLIEMDLLRKVGFYNEKAPLEDYALMLSLAKFTKFKYCGDDVYYYRWHDENTIKKASDRLDIPTKLKILSQEIDYVCTHGMDELKPMINEYYGLTQGKNLINIPGLFRCDKYKYNGQKRFKFVLLGITFWSK